MKTLIWTVIILVAMFFWLAHTNIQFKPFKISFGQLYVAIGMYMVMFGILIIQIQSNKEGYKKGVKDCTKIVHKEFDKKLDKLNKEEK